MPELQEIEIFIRPDGKVELNVRGVRGPRCRQITAGLERLLGGQIVAQAYTPEFDLAPLGEDEQQQDGFQHGRIR